MSERPRAARVEIPPVAVAAVVFLVVFGIFPLPLLVPGGGPLGNVAYWAAASLLTLGPVLLLAALPLPWLRALPARLARWLDRPSPLVFALLVGGAFTALSVALAWYAYRFAPTTADEIAQLWHAHILLHGRLTLPADPNAEFFAVDNVIDTGRWFSQFPIGGPLVLALGVLVHAPWLLDPLLGGGTAALVYHVARRAYGETQGRAAAALFALAPIPLLMSASYMNHVPVLFLAMLALAGLAEWEREPTRRRGRWIAGGIGLALGFMATIRPLDAVVVSTVVGLFQLSVIRHDRPRWRDLAVQAAFGAVGVAPLLYANWATTGGIFHFAYEVMWGPGHRLGFHVDPQGVAHTPLRALVLAAKYMSELNGYLLGWPVPALVVAVAGLLSMRRASRWDALLLGLLGAQLLAYALYWHDGEFLGPRFLYTAVGAAVILVARAPFLIAERWGGYWRFGAPLAALTGIAVAWLVPMGAYGALGLANQVRASRDTFKVDLAAATSAAHAHHALVFVHEPFSGRLIRRLWGVGFTRSAADEAFAHGDACSVLEAVRAAEADTDAAPAQRAAAAAARIATYAPGAAPIQALDPTIHISSARSLTPACRDELASDAKFGGMPFGLGLLLETIGPDGRIGGDVVYAADLGPRDSVLRARFGDRAWYRAYSEREPGGPLKVVVEPY
ncbi:MAG: hypothetical protein KGL38_03450 [Gemmatimonadota bacterium]|nr:hypothetical protein [Gemmatimonadota bacterium]